MIPAPQALALGALMLRAAPIRTLLRTLVLVPALVLSLVLNLVLALVPASAVRPSVPPRTALLGAVLQALFLAQLPALGTASTQLPVLVPAVSGWCLGLVLRNCLG